MGASQNTGRLWAGGNWEDRLPPVLRRVVAWLLSRWPGRIAIRSASSLIRIEIFDRSMSLAAQFFTSVFPILILLSSWLAGRSDELADGLNMPDQTKSVLDEAITDSTSTAFGIAGALIVLISATSLSRALTRAYAAIWELPRPKSSLRSAWRWMAVVLALALSLIAVRAMSGFTADLPPPGVWQVIISAAFYAAVGILVPWTLLSGEIGLRNLAPGALLFVVAMMAIRPATAAWLPRALETSADRYGSIGVAFTYLAWLYVVSFCLLGASAIGQVIATDPGSIGAWIRGDEPDASVDEPGVV